MIEIDGEFFIDPCETIRDVRKIVALSVAEMAITQIGLIMAEPLFTPLGGEIIPVNNVGDNTDKYSEFVIPNANCFNN